MRGVSLESPETHKPLKPLKLFKPCIERKTGLEPATYSLGSCRSTR
jgi:hypothetical protein